MKSEPPATHRKMRHSWRQALSLDEMGQKPENTAEFTRATHSLKPKSFIRSPCIPGTQWSDDGFLSFPCGRGPGRPCGLRAGRLDWPEILLPTVSTLSGLRLFTILRPPGLPILLLPTPIHLESLVRLLRAQRIRRIGKLAAALYDDEISPAEFEMKASSEAT
jgi:hypothetical protein